MILLILIVAIALSVSFTCSILEASLLSANLVRLHARRDRGDKGAARLLELKEKRLDDSISAILTYNTIAHTVGAALAGAQAARVFGDNWVGVFSAVLTLLILLLTEIIPKTIGSVHADRLAGPVGLLLSLMIRPPMKWVLYLTRAITRLLAPHRPNVTTKGDIQATLKVATRDGAITAEDARVLANLLQFEDITVADVMTPRMVCTMFEESTSLEDALASRDAHAFSRVPLFRGTKDEVSGYVIVRQLLRAARDGADPKSPVSTWSRRVAFVPESMSVGAALKEFTKSGDHLAIVVDEHGGTSGLVTMEDLIETALGVEIVDELDRTVDMRELAVRLRDKRLADARTRVESGRERN